MFVNHRRVEFQPQAREIVCMKENKKESQKVWIVDDLNILFSPLFGSLFHLFYGYICCLFLVLVIPFSSAFVRFHFSSFLPLLLTHLNILIHNFTTLNCEVEGMKRSERFTCIVWVAQHLWQSLSKIVDTFSDVFGFCDAGTDAQS